MRTKTTLLTASVAILVLTALPAAAQTPVPFAPPQTGQVLYRGATLIDGTGAPPRAHMDVLVEGERIIDVFADDPVKVAKASDAKTVDVLGLYLMPGLIDSHVHLATPPNRRQAEAMLRRDLYGGVTTVRDMADDLRSVGEITRASRVGEIAAPDIYYAALMAGPDFFTDKRTLMTSAGGQNGQVPWMQSVDASTDVPIAVAMARGTYATAIKLYADMTPEVAAKITAEAHRQHLKVWAHATLYPAKPSEVVDAGVDAISHACLLVREPSAHVPRFAEPRDHVNMDAFRAGDNPVLARLFADMIKRGTILDATVWTYGPPPPGPSSSPPLTPGGCDDDVGGAITGQAYRSGVAISAGTDSVALWDDPWPDLFHELTALHDKAHMPVSAILTSATLIGARAAGQERDMGSIAPGKLANMIVLAKNPLDSLDNLKSVVFTVKRGVTFKRSDFVPLVEADITDY